MLDLMQTFFGVPLWLWLVGVAAIIVIAILVARKLEFEGVNFTVTPPFITFRFGKRKQKQETLRVSENPKGLSASGGVNQTGGTMNAQRDIVGGSVTNIGELHQHLPPPEHAP
ncbi:hypothetical protein ANRL1_02800 [Anaerolineae bacterium]|nr:hypothetical protein ANRL1_02800 [Anaerolineae bacterium]